MNRKGISVRLVSIVLVLLAVAVIFYIYSAGLIPGINKQRKNAKCTYSMLNSLGKDAILSLDCPVEEVEITQNKIETNKALGEVARSLRNCWDSMGKGKVKPFYSKLLGLGNRVCKVCSEVKFSGDVRQTSVKGFHHYLSTRSVLRADVKYSDYLFDDESWKDKVADEMKTSEVYYGVFRICKEAWQNIPLFSCEAEEPEILFLSGTNYSELDCDYEFD